MNRLYYILIGLLAASAVLFGVLDAAGVIRLQTVYVFIYALAAGIPALFRLAGWTGKRGQVTALLLLFLVFAWLPYGWEQQEVLRAAVERLTPGVAVSAFGVVMFLISWMGKKSRI